MGTQFRGRPKSDNRTLVINFRCPEYQVERFTRTIELLHISKSDALREALAIWLNENTPKREAINESVVSQS